MSDKRQKGTLFSDNVLECKAVWKISDFRNTCHSVGTLHSPLFPLVSANDNVEWRLVIYPNKYYITNGRRKDCIGLYLDALCEYQEIKFNIVSTELSIIDSEDREVEKKYVKRHNVVTGRDNHIGIANFIPWKILLQRQEQLLPLGDLTVVCRIRTKFGFGDLGNLRSASSAMSSTMSLFSGTDAASYSFDEKSEKFGKSEEIEVKSDDANDDGYAAQLTSRLLNTSICADVLIKCSGKTFKCHRNVLASKSPVFLKKFANDIKPLTLDLGDEMTPQAVEDLLSYVYTGKLRHLKENSLLLFTIAFEYEMPDLLEKAKKELMSNLTPDRAISLLIFAQKTGATELKKLAAEFIANS